MKTTIESLDFPSEIKNKLKMKVGSTNLKMEFLSINNMEKEYNTIKKQADINRQRLKKVNESTKRTLEKSQQVKDIVNDLKPTKLTKNNYLISDNDINTINEYIENVDSNVSETKSVNDLTNLMEDFEIALNNHYDQIDDLENTIDGLNEDILKLNSTIST